MSEIAALLRERGHRVELLERSSESLAGARGRVRAGAAMLRGGLHARDVANAIGDAARRPPRPQHQPAVRAARARSGARAGARVVMHLHNYRLFCAIAIAYRDGAVCTRCRGRNTLPGVRLRCRGSVAEAAVYATALAASRSASSRTSIASSFRAGRRPLGRARAARARLRVLHNFLPEQEFAASSSRMRGPTLWSRAGWSRRRASTWRSRPPREPGCRCWSPAPGRTPDGSSRSHAPQGPDSVRGRLSPDEMAPPPRAAFALAPSRWDEPCPYSVHGGDGRRPSGLDDGPRRAARDRGRRAGAAAARQRSWAQAMSDLWQDRDRRRGRGACAGPCPQPVRPGAFLQWVDGGLRRRAP